MNWLAAQDTESAATATYIRNGDEGFLAASRNWALARDSPSATSSRTGSIDAAIQVCADRGLRNAPIERVVRGDGALLEAARGGYARTRSARKAWEALARRAGLRHARRRLSFELVSVSPRSTSRSPRVGVGTGQSARPARATRR